MNRISGLSFVLLLSAAGLAFGADMYPAGSVSVAVAPAGVPLSLNVPGVLVAIQIAGGVLAPAGFVYGTGPENANMPDRFAYFTRDNSVGNPTACEVLFRNNRVDFYFFDTGMLHSGSAAAQLRNQLATALRYRFGAASVQVWLK
jgi:hypothetical protein